MKRKIFSKLLAGAILVAAVSSFVSCKDYDDDINDLRNQISAKSSELSKDLNDKIQTVTNTIAGLQSQVSEMDKAYKASDAALQTLISTTASGALAEAKSYADNKASETLASAKAAAESFATIQAAQAQAAAIAAAKEALAQAQAELNAALAEANATIASQGTTINGLLEADKVLTTAISAAQTKADAAYTLAEQANKLAESNKANIEKNAEAITALQKELTALKGAAAEIQTVTKLQSDLENMAAKLNETAASLDATKTTLASVQTDLATLKQSLETQTKILGEKITEVLGIANANTADIQAAKTQLTELKNSNEQAIAAINATIETLAGTVAANKADVISSLNALKTLIQENKTAIETLLDTKIADLQKLIGANADEIAANKLAADKAIGENAAAILKNAGDITTIANAVKALQEAFGKETAATLKAYAESAASASAEGAKKYADAQDAAAKIAILEAVLALNYQNKEAVEAAINTAIAALEKTYNLATLYETIKAGDDDAKQHADEVAAKALEDAKHWADDVRTYLDQNFTNTKDMQAQIEAAKNSAIAIAYKMVIDALLNGTDKDVPTIAQEVKKQVEAYVDATTYSKADADKMVEDAIEAALKAAMVPSEPAEMGKPAVQAGVIMAAIEAAAEKAASDLETYKKEQAAVDKVQDGRIKDIEDFLNNTFEDKSFNSAVAALIADDQNVKTLQANYGKLSGELAALTSFVQGEDGIASILAELKANHEQLYADVANISATIKNINALFAPTASARRAAEEAGGKGLVVATEEPVIDEQDLATFFNVIKGLVENQKNNEELAATVKGEAIKAVNASLGAEVKKLLNSIVLRPEYYTGGIEAIEVPALVKHAVVDLGGNQKTITEFIKGTNQNCTIYPDAEAYYHINPIGADIEGYIAQFYTNTAITRSTPGNDAFAKVQFGDKKEVSHKLTADDLKEHYKNGILEVPFNIERSWLETSNNYYKANLKDGQKTFIAFQLTKTEKINDEEIVRNITSDYALVEPSDYSNLRLAYDDTKKRTKTDQTTHTVGVKHLWQTAQDAANDAKYSDQQGGAKITVIDIAYNESIDLDDYIEIHYDYSTPWSQDADLKMDAKTQKKLGLNITYTPITWTKGSNLTSETVHMTIDEDNKVTPRNVDEKGNTIADKPANASAVGREPIYRVELWSPDGKRLAGGYIKLRIVKPEQIEEDVDKILEKTFDMSDYYQNCNVNSELKVKWSVIEYHIYNDLLQISKSDFEDQYTFLADYQFIKDGNNKWIAVDDAAPFKRAAGKYTVTDVTLNNHTPLFIGLVKELPDPDDPTTNVLSWKPYQTGASYYTPEQIYSMTSVAQLTGLSTKDLKVRVAFVQKKYVGNIGDDAAMLKALKDYGVLVTLNIPAGKLHYAVGDLDNSLKIPSYWYNLNSSTLGKREIHDNIVDVDDSNAKTKAGNHEGKPFNLDILGTFEGGQFGLGYASQFNNKALNEYEFYFTYPHADNANTNTLTATYNNQAKRWQWTVNGNVPGNVYTLWVADNDKTKLMATKGTQTETIAILTGTNNKDLQLQENEFTKDIINYVGKAKGNNDYLNDNKKAFTMYIGVVADNGCYTPFLKNRFFNVRVLRPLNMLRGNGGVVIDASPNSADHKVYIKDLVNLYDWRDVDLLNNGVISHQKYKTNVQDQFWSYYGSEVTGGIVNVEVDENLNNWYTDNFNGATDVTGNVADSQITSKLKKLTSVFTTLNPEINQIEFDQAKDNTVKEDKGWIKIPNIGATTEVFHIYVPVTLTYNWGTKTQRTYGVITVRKTTATSRQF